jgi:hypothetical protein
VGIFRFEVADRIGVEEVAEGASGKANFEVDDRFGVEGVAEDASGRADLPYFGVDDRVGVEEDDAGVVQAVAVAGAPAVGKVEVVEIVDAVEDS